MNYSEFAALPQSQKITLAVIRAKQRLKNFENQGGDTWTRATPYFVSNVIGAPFDYNPLTSVLTIISAINPNTLNIIVEYSFFFSDFPVNREVEYVPLLEDIGRLKLELDTENTGIAVESDSSIKLTNTSGFFDNIYDTLIWENQLCEFYSWSPILTWSERKLIYKGYINTKSFSDKTVTFTIKDTFFKLREKIPFEGTRLIYGKAKNLNCSPLDLVNDGFALSGQLSGRNDRDLLTGAISGVLGSSTITGVGTSFLSQLSVSGKIRVIDGLIEYTYTVNAIANNNSLTVSGTISNTFAGAQGRNAEILNNIITGIGTDFFNQVSPGDSITILENKYTITTIESSTQLIIEEQIKSAFLNESALNLPEINYRKKNRFWNVSGHLLADYAVNIIAVYSQSIFEVSDISHLYDDDIISINGNIYSIERVSGNIITINQSAVSIISTGNEVYKLPIQRLAIGLQSYIPIRDYTISNTESGCQIGFNSFAEFNVASEVVAGTSFTFSVGSRTVTSLSSSVDLTEIYKSRDWIKPFSGSVSSWYEILEVRETTLILREVYSEARSYTGPALYKSPSYIGDNSEVLVDCLGKKSTSGVWLKTASDAVKDICSYLEMDNIDLAGFENAKQDAPYCLSIVYPDSIGGEMPIARDMITDINKSVFGSLYSNDLFDISYSILNADRDEEYETIRDDDIESFTTSTKNQIVKTVTASYRKEYGTDNKQTYSFSNENMSGINTELPIDLALYDEADAKVVTQRYAFLRSNSQTIVNIKGKLNLASKALNSRVYLSLNRLFKRFGSAGNIKIGLVNLISKDSKNVEIQVNDLGNIFSRVGTISPNSAVDYSSASDDEISRYLFIVDNNTETPDTDSDVALGANLIG